MAHTDKDIARNFWDRHYGRNKRERTCTLYALRGGRWNYYIRGTCWCDTVHNGWTSPYKFEQGKPSWHNKGIRRRERAFTRNLIQRAFTGHIDWERVDDTKGDEYYW